MSEVESLSLISQYAINSKTKTVNLTYLRQALTELTSIEALGKKWPSVSLGAQVSESLSFIL